MLSVTCGKTDKPKECTYSYPDMNNRAFIFLCSFIWFCIMIYTSDKVSQYTQQKQIQQWLYACLTGLYGQKVYEKFLQPLPFLTQFLGPLLRALGSLRGRLIKKLCLLPSTVSFHQSLSFIALCPFPKWSQPLAFLFAKQWPLWCSQQHERGATPMEVSSCD